MERATSNHSIYYPHSSRRIAIGRDGWPFTLTDRRYPRGLCPVAERLHKREFLRYETCAWRLGESQIDALIEAFRKVHAGRSHIAGRAAG